MQIFVGPDGRVWHPDSPALQRYVGSFRRGAPETPSDLHDLGFAAVLVFPHYVKVTLLPSHFPGKCRDKIIALLVQEGPRSIIIQRLGATPATIDVIHNLNDALGRLRALSVYERPNEPYAPTIVGLALERLAHPKRQRLKDAYASWRTMNGRTTSMVADKMPDDPLLGGGTLAWMPSRDRCIVKSWPKTYNSYDQAAENEFVGRDLVELPDPDYILPTSQAYFSVAHRQEPRLDLVDAMITLTDGSKLWARYERLMLHWRTNSADTYISTVPLLRMIRRC